VTVLQAVWLGVVQGLTEFLPISSSAHLILVRDLFGWEAGAAEIAFDVACHLGTLLAVLVYFRDDIATLLAAAPGALIGQPHDAAHTGRLVIAATIPIVLVGGLFADEIERLRTPPVAAVALTVGALAMLMVERISSPRRPATSLSLVEALGLGCAQAAALIPGVSRSGAVLTFGLFCGLARADAARFAFLMGVPAILGGGSRAAWMLGWAGVAEHAVILLVGIVTSGVVGYLAITGLFRYLARHSLALFAYYRLVVAAALMIRLAVTA